LTPGEQGRETHIPKLASGVDVRRLSITPMEAFVLSRVDGRASGAEIALTTGLPTSEVVAILQKLRGIGAVQYPDGVPAATTSNSGIDPTAPRPDPNVKPAVDVRIRVAAERPAYDPRELDETADLNPERKHQILQTFHRLPELSHYELLGVARSADKKAIKSAYFDVVGRFHPDKYFGKALGGFKPKLERIFQRVTEAHDTLTRAASREEYDRYLESQQATRAFEEVKPASVDDIRREIEREAALVDQSGYPRGAPPGEEGSKHPSSLPAGNLPSGGPAARSAPPAFSESPPRPALSSDERRRALARKLGASMPPSRQPPADRPASIPTTREAAGEALRRRYEARLEQARQERVQRYMKQADDAIAANNLISAANALRIAVSLAPEDVPLADQLEKLERQAAATMADQYLEQARYDERRGHMAEAALAYEKVIRGRPSAHVYERAAHCLLEAQKDPKKAFDLAKKAVELSPNETAYRITLARVYAKAGMAASAMGELERARTLDPGDDTVKDWIKRMKRGEI
jgi:curved DNA-binding protein CbpA